MTTSVNLSIMQTFNASTVTLPLHSIDISGSGSSGGGRVIVVTQELKDGKVVSTSKTTT